MLELEQRVDRVGPRQHDDGARSEGLDDDDSLPLGQRLGRAGYETHAVAASSRAMGLQSTYARHTATHPSYGDPAFCDWLAAYVSANAIRSGASNCGLTAA